MDPDRSATTVPRVAAHRRRRWAIRNAKRGGGRSPRSRCAPFSALHAWTPGWSPRAARRGDDRCARSTRIASCSSGWWSSGAITSTPTSTPSASTRPTRIARRSAGGMRSARSARCSGAQRHEPGDAQLPEQHGRARGPRRTRTTRARCMELHTLGVDGGYTQQDVVEVARCFTGWRTYGQHGRRARRARSTSTRTVTTTTSKIVLGVPIAAGGGINDGLNVHQDPRASIRRPRGSSSRKLLRWFFDYDPSTALVTDIAGEFTRTQRQHQGAGPPHPAATRTCCGRRRSSSGRSTTSRRRCA